MARRGDQHDNDLEGPATRRVPAVDLLGTEPADGAGPDPGRHSPLRYRVLPRSLLGLTALILSFAIGAGLSGVVLYSYYQYKLNQTNDRVNTVITGYKKQFANAEGDLQASAAAAKADIQAQLGPIQALEASPATLAKLAKQLAPSLFFVHTLDANGQASVGTAFVVSSNSTQSLLLTSYTTVAAATRSPAPPVYVQRGQTSTAVHVRTWDQTYDLALIVLPQGNLPVISAAPSTPAPEVGERVYAVSGLGSAGAALSQGLITDVSADGVEHDAPLGAAYQGGPLVNDAGQVIAVGSRSYAPLGFSTDSVWYAPYVQAACNKVLSCPGGNLSGSQ
ncbi:serine protease [Acidiferrimicrobium sp. IK]|uniref:S1 family peptidase n=1 Tax=Acidiferrimicrobium sp. IK TaxID=2871700 RepID=UPI0021CAF504|nr:serine protease [Acidiferrimicrobium sp. IK]MCU4186230.1 serine protease [Acidiferrimicrobium sp. IK]